jgi:hypothetical protein
MLVSVYGSESVLKLGDMSYFSRFSMELIKAVVFTDPSAIANLPEEEARAGVRRGSRAGRGRERGRGRKSGTRGRGQGGAQQPASQDPQGANSETFCHYSHLSSLCFVRFFAFRSDGFSVDIESKDHYHVGKRVSLCRLYVLETQ